MLISKRYPGIKYVFQYFCLNCAVKLLFRRTDNMSSRRAGAQSQESMFSSSVVGLVDWPQAPTSDQGLAALPGQRWLLMGWRSLSVVRGEVMLIQRTPRASGKPQAMSHTGATEQCCGKTLWVQKHQSCGQQKSRSCMVFFCLQIETVFHILSPKRG